MMATSFLSLSNPMFILIITALVLLLSVYIYNRPQTKGKKYHPIPGTKFHQFIHFRRLHHYMTDLAVKYKTYKIYSPFNSEIYTTDPANVEYILRTNFENYGKGPFMNHTLKDLLGDGIFTVDGDEWREQRKVSSHEFSKKVLRDFSGVVFTENTIKVGNILLEAANNNQTVDITDLFMKSTTDSIFKVGFGIDFDNVSGSNEKGAIFCRAFDDANEFVLRRFFDLSWKIQKFFNIGPERELRKNIKIIDDVIYKLIDTKMEQMKDAKDDTLLKKQDLLSRFLQIPNIDPKYVRDIVVTFVLAGKDPIATSLYWFIYELCKHPQIQDKVAKEIREATKMSIQELEIIDVAEFATRVTEEALDKMTYLHAALTETIRLYPALSMDPKTCFSDDVLPDGGFIKKGEVVVYMPYAMGRMKFLWGDDALEFKPERWIDENGVFHQASPFKFTAFQAGPRTCMGRDFAYRQMKIFSSILLGCFTFKLSDERKIPNYRVMINLQMDGPLHVYASKRYGADKSENSKGKDLI